MTRIFEAIHCIYIIDQMHLPAELIWPVHKLLSPVMLRKINNIFNKIVGNSYGLEISNLLTTICNLSRSTGESR
jgi:hypothetical protein